VLLAVHGSGALIGAADAVVGRDDLATAEAIDDCSFTAMPWNRIQQAGQSAPSVYQNLLNQLAIEHRETDRLRSVLANQTHAPDWSISW
jgi:CRP-like cAMP-binding protein